MIERPREAVTASDSLYRLVSPDYVEPDGHVNLFAYCYRKSRKPDPAISVDVARLVERPEDTLIRSKFEGTQIGGAKTYAECELMARATNLRNERRTKDGIAYD